MAEEQASPYQVHLQAFEGPLDLLLHLIKVNEIDIYDIPIADITQQYLDYLDLMRELNLDIASEYLVMAATLAHIKSKLLVPSYSEATNEEEDGQDPRKALVDQLLEYQRYKGAAEQLENKEILGRDVFIRAGTEMEAEDDEFEVSLFDLMEALRQVLEKVGGKERLLDFTTEKISLKEKMVEIVEKLRTAEFLLFEEIFSAAKSRYEVVVTFLALLELIRTQKIRTLQIQTFGSIRIYSRDA